LQLPIRKARCSAFQARQFSAIALDVKIHVVRPSGQQGASLFRVELTRHFARVAAAKIFRKNSPSALSISHAYKVVRELDGIVASENRSGKFRQTRIQFVFTEDPMQIVEPVEPKAVVMGTSFEGECIRNIGGRKTNTKLLFEKATICLANGKILRVMYDYS
jgi:hypothetical protein